MRLIDILVAQSFTQDLDQYNFEEPGLFVFFRYEGKMWGAHVWECAGTWVIEAGELGKAWEAEQLTEWEKTLYNHWCGLE